MVLIEYIILTSMDPFPSFLNLLNADAREMSTVALMYTATDIRSAIGKEEYCKFADFRRFAETPERDGRCHRGEVCSFAGKAVQ
jgi:hypothetical protein